MSTTADLERRRRLGTPPPLDAAALPTAELERLRHWTQPHAPASDAPALPTAHLDWRGRLDSWTPTPPLQEAALPRPPLPSHCLAWRSSPGVWRCAGLVDCKRDPAR